MAETGVSIRTKSGITKIVKTNPGAGAFDIPVVIGFPKNASPQGQNWCSPKGGGKNWMFEAWDLKVGQAGDCCQVFSLRKAQTEIDVPVSIGYEKVTDWLETTHQLSALKSGDPPIGSLEDDGWLFTPTGNSGGTFEIQLVGFVGSNGFKCKKVKGTEDRIYGTASFELESYEKSVTLKPCYSEGGPDCWELAVQEWLTGRVFKCTKTFWDTYAGANESGGKELILFNFGKYISKGKKVNNQDCKIKKKKICCEVSDAGESEGGIALSNGINYYATLGTADCTDVRCKTGQHFRKYLRDIMATELAIGGFPFIVPESLTETMVRVLDGEEIYVGYSLAGERVERTPLAQEVIQQHSYDASWKLKPAAYNDPDPEKIGFALSAEEAVKKSHPGLTDEDVWNVDVFANFSRSVMYEMVNVWRQTIEASVGYPSDTGVPWYKKIEGSGSGGQAILNYLRGPGGTPVTRTAPDIYLTAHELELRKMWINQYERMSAAANISLYNKKMKFSSTISTADGGDFTVSSVMSIKDLMGNLLGLKNYKDSFKDKLTVTLPTIKIEEGDEVLELDHLEMEYTLFAEGNWTFNISGIKPLEYIAKGEGKIGGDLSPKTPIAFQIDYKTDDNNAMVTLDYDTAGNAGLALTYELQEGSMVNGMSFLEGTKIQTGMIWDNANQKFAQSWALSKGIGEHLTFQLSAAGARVSTALQKEFGSDDRYLGQVDVGFAAALSANVFDENGNKLGWGANANLKQSKTVWETGTILGDIVWESTLGLTGGSRSGKLAGWSIQGGGWTGTVFKNDAISLFGIPFNVWPTAGVGVSWFCGKVNSSYFGSEWEGMEWAVNFGLFGLRIRGVGRKQIIERIIKRKRYSAGLLNLWGLLPWGGGYETDEDYIGRAWPCLMEQIVAVAKDAWKNELKKVVTPACWALKDVEQPLINFLDQTSKEQAAKFYDFWVLEPSLYVKRGEDPKTTGKKTCNYGWNFSRVPEPCKRQDGESYGNSIKEYEPVYFTRLISLRSRITLKMMFPKEITGMTLDIALIMKR